MEKIKFNNGKLRILQISDAQDLHWVRKTMLLMLENACEQLKPDLIVFTGDNILGNHLRDYRFSSKKKAYNTKMLLILLFVWFAGFTPSLLRAFIFSIIIYILSALHIKKINDISSLSLCFLIHSAIQPTHIQTPAFMLSYGALFGIITVGSFFKEKLSKIFALKIVATFCDSFGAQICTFPILIYLFGEVAPIGVISSLIVSPLLTIFLYTGLIGIIICMIIPFLSPAFNDIIDVIYNIISNLIVYFSSFPLITLRN